MNVHGWGRYPVIDAEVLLPRSKSICRDLILERQNLTPRGLGRSYGDSAIGPAVLETKYINHFTEFDPVTGILTCEAGVSINEILKLVVPKGWFIPVSPGTSYVSLGGAIASDVHGKNHHINGTFSNHVLWIDLMLGNGSVVRTSSNELPDLFKATCGGMGLTGIILAASIQLKKISSSKIIQTTIKTNSLDEVCEQFESNQTSTYSVAWIDCLAKDKKLGRSLLMLGEHATDGEFKLAKQRAINIPMDMPAGLLNRYSIKVFNALYYHKTTQTKRVQTLPFEPYFYPLDAMANWNRLYGRAGFIQYQFVLPKTVGVYGLRSILNAIVKSGRGSFLAVLKAFGKANDNFLSFPMEGYTLALDFKMCPETVHLISKLDSMIVHMGGRIYLTKDALMSEATFKATYPQWEKFEQVRANYGAIGKFNSTQSKRLGLQ